MHSELNSQVPDNGECQFPRNEISNYTAMLTFSQWLQYTLQAWFDGNNTVPASLDCGLTFRSAEAREISA